MRLLILSLCTIVLLSSCKSVNYRARAVERARVYLLEKTRDLPEVKRDYIRYTSPQIMTYKLYSREGIEESDKNWGADSKHDLMHICIVWKVPNIEYPYVVFGVSERWMADWHPSRLIRKKYLPVDAYRNTAVKSARNYVMQKMLFLSDEVRNRVRFMEPQILATTFKIDEADSDGKDKKKEEEVDKRELRWGLAEKKDNEKAKPIQVSLVWKADKPGQFVVITGMADKSLLLGKTITEDEEKSVSPWEFVFGYLRTKEELDKNSLSDSETKK